MIKFYVKETDEEVTFGDVVELTLSKECDLGVVNRTVECVLTEATMALLVDMNVIEKRTIIDFCDNKKDDPIEELCETSLQHAQHIRELEEKFLDIKNTVSIIREDVGKILNDLSKK